MTDPTETQDIEVVDDEGNESQRKRKKIQQDLIHKAKETEIAEEEEE